MTAKARKFPALSTKRLTLRAPSLADASTYRVLFPEVTRFSNWPDVPSKAKVERGLRWMCKLFASGKGCAWIVEHRRSKAVVGVIRFNRIDKKWQWGELGYESHPDFWGKGLMTEAVKAVVACGHDFFGLNRIEAWTLPGNTASDRVLEKTGFRYEGTLREKARFKGGYHDFRMFGRLARDTTKP